MNRARVWTSFAAGRCSGAADGDATNARTGCPAPAGVKSVEGSERARPTYDGPALMAASVLGRIRHCESSVLQNDGELVAVTAPAHRFAAPNLEGCTITGNVPSGRTRSLASERLRAKRDGRWIRADRRRLRVAAGTVTVLAVTLSMFALTVSTPGDTSAAAATESGAADTPNPTASATSDPRWPSSIAGRKILDQYGNVYVLKIFSSWGMAQNLTDAEITEALEGRGPRVQRRDRRAQRNRRAGGLGQVRERRRRPVLQTGAGLPRRRSPASWGRPGPRWTGLSRRPSGSGSPS